MLVLFILANDVMFFLFNLVLHCPLIRISATNLRKMSIIRSLCILSVLLYNVNAYRILGVFSHPGISHFAVFQPLLQELAKRGHDVTVISSFPLKHSISGYRDVDFSKDVENMLQIFQLKDLPPGGKIPKFLGVQMVKRFAEEACGRILASKKLHDFLKEDHTQFDVIISEFFNSNCLLIPVFEKYKAPIIGATSHVLMPWANSWLGNIDNPAFVPDIFMDFSDNMSFRDRLENTLALAYHNLYYKYVIRKQDIDLIRKNLNLDVRVAYYDSIMNNVSAVLVNSHFSLSLPRPLAPGVIDVGGVHLTAHRKLPLVIVFLERHEHVLIDGVIKYRRFMGTELSQFLLTVHIHCWVA